MLYRATMLEILAALGESDCEYIGDGLLAQPVNAVSSLTFSAVGAAVLVWAGAAQNWERRFRQVLGILLVLTGLGSFLYHGPQTAGSLFAHDITFLAAIIVVAGTDGALVLRWPESRSWSAIAVVLIVFGLVLVLWPTVTNVLTATTVVMLVASDVPLHRIGGIDRGWYVAALVLVGLALLFFLLGRTGGPLCTPDSLFQGHGLWHILSALALGAYVVATAPTRQRLEAQ